MANMIQILDKNKFYLESRGMKMTLTKEHSAVTGEFWRMHVDNASSRAYSGLGVREFDTIEQVEQHYKSWRGIAALIESEEKKEIINVRSFIVQDDQQYKAVIVFYPESNHREAALYDVKNNGIVGLEADRPYHPVGGTAAIESIIKGNPENNIPSGLVTGSKNYLFECWHCCGKTYRLGKQPN